MWSPAQLHIYLNRYNIVIIDKIKITNDFKNIKLPITPKERAEFIKSLPKEQEQSYRYSWLHNTDNRSNMYINQGM